MTRKVKPAKSGKDEPWDSGRKLKKDGSARKKPGPKPRDPKAPRPDADVAVKAASTPETPPKIPGHAASGWKLWLPPIPQTNDDENAHPYFQWHGRKMGGVVGLGNEPENGFGEDWRTDRPGLHLHYVKTAVTHLRLLDECIMRLALQSNLNMDASVEALQRERMVLVFSNAAYWDAEEILRLLGLRVGIRLQDDSEG